MATLTERTLIDNLDQIDRITEHLANARRLMDAVKEAGIPGEMRYQLSEAVVQVSRTEGTVVRVLNEARRLKAQD